MAQLFVVDKNVTFKRMSTRFNEMRKRGELVDFSLFNNLGNEVKGHMIVMAVSCPIIKYLADSFSNERRLLLRDVSAEAMELLMNFMYTGELEITTDTVNCLLYGAIQLELSPIEVICIDFMRVNEIYENNDPVSSSKLRRCG